MIIGRNRSKSARQADGITYGGLVRPTTAVKKQKKRLPTLTLSTVFRHYLSIPQPRSRSIKKSIYFFFVLELKLVKYGSPTAVDRSNSTVFGRRIRWSHRQPAIFRTISAMYDFLKLHIGKKSIKVCVNGAEY